MVMSRDENQSQDATEKVKNPSRRQFLKTTCAIAAGGVLGLPLMEGASQAKAYTQQGKARNRGRLKRRPNILLMLVDEMRYPPVYEAEGARQFRQQYLLTQNVLRANGVEFHRHYAASTACSPSRASLFTGHYPSLHGVTNTTGAAKEANDPDVFWLDPGSVPTMGDYFRAGGYHTYYKGKWHASDADLQIPGTHNQIVSYDDQGNPDPEKEQLYLEANRLDGYGFTGWIGPEPHGKAPLNTGASPAVGQGRDVGFAAQTVKLLDKLDSKPTNAPWLMVSSFVNPHDIALWGFFTRNVGLFDFTVEDVVPGFASLFDPLVFAQTLTDELSTKPSCQEKLPNFLSCVDAGYPTERLFPFLLPASKRRRRRTHEGVQRAQAVSFLQKHHRRFHF